MCRQFCYKPYLMIQSIVFVMGVLENANVVTGLFVSTIFSTTEIVLTIKISSQYKIDKQYSVF